MSPTRCPASFRGFAASLLALSFAACAHQTGTGAAPGSTVTKYDMEPVKIEAVRGPAGIQIEAFDASELFEHGTKAHADHRFDDAERAYLRLLSAFPDSVYGKPALYNLALVYQDKKDWTAAVERFKAFLARWPEGKDGKDATFQLGATYAEAGQWEASRDLFERVLERGDLSADDRVEALARRGFAQLNLGALDTAENSFRNVFALKQRLEATREERLETDYYLAFSQYQLGQISHRRSNAVALRWPESQMNLDLEERARLLLQARRQYIDAVRYGNPRIASMAAFQIGTLFQEFYDAVLSVPPPRELTADAKREERDVYFDELRKKLRIVLEKALRGHEHNIELFERLGVETEWVTKSRDAIAKLKELLDPANTSFHFADPNASPAVPAAGSTPAPAEPTPERPADPRDRKPPPGSDVQRQVL